MRESEVEKVDVDLAKKQVIIETKRGQTMSDLKVIQLLRNAGYVTGKIARRGDKHPFHLRNPNRS